MGRAGSCALPAAPEVTVSAGSSASADFHPAALQALTAHARRLHQPKGTRRLRPLLRKHTPAASPTAFLRCRTRSQGHERRGCDLEAKPGRRDKDSLSHFPEADTKGDGPNPVSLILINEFSKPLGAGQSESASSGAFPAAWGCPPWDVITPRSELGHRNQEWNFPSIWGTSCLTPRGLIFDQDLQALWGCEENLCYMVHLLAICSRTGHCM